MPAQRNIQKTDETPEDTKVKQVTLLPSVVSHLGQAGVESKDIGERLAGILNKKYGDSYTDVNEVARSLENGKAGQTFTTWNKRKYVTPFSDRVLRAVNELRTEKSIPSVSIYELVGAKPQTAKKPLDKIADTFWNNVLAAIEDQKIRVKHANEFLTSPMTKMSDFFARLHVCYTLLEDGTPHAGTPLSKLATQLRRTPETILPPKDWAKAANVKLGSQQTQAPLQGEKHRRGRPRKKPEVTTASLPPATPKRRGRPPKKDRAVAKAPRKAKIVRKTREKHVRKPKAVDPVDFKMVAAEVLKIYFEFDEFQKAYANKVKGEKADEITSSLNAVRAEIGDNLADARKSYEFGRNALFTAAKKAGAELTMTTITKGLETFEKDRSRVYLERHIKGESDEKIASFMVRPDPEIVRSARENLLGRIADTMRNAIRSAPKA